MKCPSCGADDQPDFERCQYCGTYLESSPARSDSSSDCRTTFEIIKRSPEYAQRKSAGRLAAIPRPGTLETMIPQVFFAVFIAGSAVIAMGMLGIGGVAGGIGGVGFGVLPMLMAVVPVGFVVIGVLGFLNVRRRGELLSNSPIMAEPAIVTGKRTSITGGGKNSSATTRHFATFEDENGSRREYRVSSELYSQLSDDDAGVVFTIADTAVAFDRVTTA